MDASDMNNISVSVIIPVYNAAKYLRETLDYVCNQTLRDIEIICVDDGSTDDSLGILQEYAARDGRFRILQQKNQYAGVARNNGMAAARGKYMAFWDSDDIFLPEMLEKLYNRAEETRADLVCCDGMEYDEDKKQLRPAPWILPGLCSAGVNPVSFNPLQQAPGDIFSYSGSAPWNKVYKREFVEANRISWLETQSSNDLTFVCHCMALAGRVSLLDEVLVHYRVHSSSIWHSKSKSPRNMYEAHAELLRRMKSLGLEKRTDVQLRGHLLDEMSQHLSSEVGGAAKERAALYEREYEPLFRLMDDDHPELKGKEIYQHLKAFMAPDMTVVVPMERYAEGEECCLESLSPYCAEIILDTTGADEAAARQAREIAESAFWIRVSTPAAPAPPKARRVATLSPGHFLPPPWRFNAAALRCADGEALNLDSHSRRYAYNPRFYIDTPRKRSWLFFGIPLLTHAHHNGTTSAYSLGKHLYDLKS